MNLVVVKLPSRVQLFAISWAAARQAFLSFTVFWSLLKLMSIDSVMPSDHLILFLWIWMSLIPQCHYYYQKLCVSSSCEIKYTRLDGLNNGSALPHSAGRPGPSCQWRCFSWGGFSPWLADGHFVLPSHVSFLHSCTLLVLLLLPKTANLLDQGPTLMIAFNCKHLFKGPFSKNRHI